MENHGNTDWVKSLEGGWEQSCPTTDITTVKSRELGDTLEINQEEMHDYFWKMKNEMMEKLWKDNNYNEHKDYLSDKYALTKTKEKYWYDTVMKRTYFKDIQESVDNRDDYLSERWEEIEDF